MKQQDSHIGREILALEKQFWNAIRDKDAATAAALSDDSCVVVGAQGVGEMDKAALATMVEGASYDLNEFTFDDVHVRQLTDDVVAVAYKVKEGLVVEGQDLNLDAFDSSIWLRRGDHWVCVVHTESLAGDPYGRH